MTDEADAAAVATAKKYLSYFQGTVDECEAPDQRRMRHIIPENRVRTYDMQGLRPGRTSDVRRQRHGVTNTKSAATRLLTYCF